jgi:hypothetical protein
MSYMHITYVFEKLLKEEIRKKRKGKNPHGRAKLVLRNLTPLARKPP